MMEQGETWILDIEKEFHGGFFCAEVVLLHLESIVGSILWSLKTHAHANTHRHTCTHTQFLKPENNISITLPDKAIRKCLVIVFLLSKLQNWRLDRFEKEDTN